MGQYAELEKFRLKLWDRYVVVRDFYGGINISFKDLWFDFLARYFVSETPSIQIFDQVCRDMEKYIVKSKPS